MATIEEAIRAMLTTGTTLSAAGVADAAVTHGFRLQSSSLPAVTFEAQQPETLTLGDGFKRVSVEIRAIATTTKAANDLAAPIRTVCTKGTYDTIVFAAVQWLNSSIEPAVVAEGDEQQPAQCSCFIDIYYEA